MIILCLCGVVSALRSSETLLLGGRELFQDGTSLRSCLWYWGLVRLRLVMKPKFRAPGCRCYGDHQRQDEQYRHESPLLHSLCHDEPHSLSSLSFRRASTAARMVNMSEPHPPTFRFPLLPKEGRGTLRPLQYRPPCCCQDITLF